MSTKSFEEAGLKQSPKTTKYSKPEYRPHPYEDRH
jgi:hypothetical protein